MTKTKKKKVRGHDTTYHIRCYNLWMADNQAKMTSLDHRELFRLLNQEKKGAANEAP